MTQRLSWITTLIKRQLRMAFKISSASWSLLSQLYPWLFLVLTSSCMWFLFLGNSIASCTLFFKEDTMYWSLVCSTLTWAQHHFPTRRISVHTQFLIVWRSQLNKYWVVMNFSYCGLENTCSRIESVLNVEQGKWQALVSPQLIMSLLS